MSLNINNKSKFKNQTGLTLIESLVALVVLALGIMGLAGVQTRLLVETRTANSRAIAVGLIDDLTNRMSLNRTAAIGKPQVLPVTAATTSQYVFAWGGAATGTAMPTYVNCGTTSTTTCTPAEMAQSDLFQWRTTVNAAFPGGQATVFQIPTATGDNRQLGIAIAWALNEKSTDTTYNNPFLVTNATSNVNCPANLICHVVYVQP
jgi:type IV pilus assembly protein PilV